jgi:hypothetical protein
MTQSPGELMIAGAASDGMPVRVLARRLADAGLGVQCSRSREHCTLNILGAASGKSFRDAEYVSVAMRKSPCVARSRSPLVAS